MSVLKVIIISGPPSTGKTTLAKKVAKSFRLPIVNCDPIRKLLYNVFNCSDLVTFRETRKAGFALMYNILELLLSCNQNLIFDSSLWSKDNNGEKIQRLQKKYKLKCLQINLRADGRVLWNRYQERILSGHRHKLYLYNLKREELKRKIMKGFSIPPKIRGRTMIVDTTDFKKVDYKGLLKTIKNFLKG